jgi:tRNA threonylcarbamoyladenosine biosynthesis protein TsaB
MVVLALDTTTKGGSCAVARDGVLLRERAGDGDRGHDARLPADLMAILDDAGVGLAEVDVFAVATGPGSFTGLRIGIATMQGLAFARSKPLIGVSAFDALAHTAPRGRVATWMDAWRGEVYAALYDDGREIQPPTVQAPTALLRTLRGTPTLFAGEAAATHRHEILDTLGGDAQFADPPAPLIAGTIALIAADVVRAGQCPPPHAIRPVYVRRPDPEPAREPRPVG